MTSQPEPEDIPVKASKGEFMLSAEAVNHYGRGLMEAMNARRKGAEAVSGPERSGSHLRWILRRCRSWRGLRYLLFGWELRRQAKCGESRWCMRATVWGSICEWHLARESGHSAARTKKPGGSAAGLP